MNVKRFQHITFVLAVFLLSYVLSEADLFERYLPKTVSLLQNQKLIIFSVIADSIWALVTIGFGVFLKTAYRRNKHKGLLLLNYVDYIANLLLIFGLLYILSLTATWVNFPWIMAIVKFIGAYYLLKIFNCAVKDRRIFMNIPEPRYLYELFREVGKYFKKDGAA